MSERERISDDGTRLHTLPYEVHHLPCTSWSLLTNHYVLNMGTARRGEPAILLMDDLGREWWLSDYGDGSLVEPAIE